MSLLIAGDVMQIRGSASLNLWPWFSADHRLHVEIYVRERSGTGQSWGSPIELRPATPLWMSVEDG